MHLKWENESNYLAEIMHVILWFVYGNASKCDTFGLRNALACCILYLHKVIFQFQRNILCLWATICSSFQWNTPFYLSTCFGIWMGIFVIAKPKVASIWFKSVDFVMSSSIVKYPLQIALTSLLLLIFTWHWNWGFVSSWNFLRK